MLQRTIVFAGDSTTDSHKKNTPDGMGQGYVSLVHNALIAFRPWEKNKIINAGVSGNTSRDLVARYATDVMDCRPDIVFCMIGINDVWRQIDMSADEKDLVYEKEYAENLEKICKMTCGKSKLFFMTPFFMERNPHDEMRILSDTYCAVMKSVGAKYSVPVVDMQAAFDEYMQHRPGISLSWDRVHPEPVGIHIIARKVWETLTEYLNATKSGK